MASLPEPTRAAALQHLQGFLPRAGSAYRQQRNLDAGPGRHAHVSRLSPHLRRRLLTEAEAAAAARARHGADADKFVQELTWRTHWKGWLEHRPEAWRRFARAAAEPLDSATEAAIAHAEHGRTGLTCFDAWARELVETHYLHNHARMWFASIWTFTLGLPWERGADFFLRHLLDGDPASNTLSWRWVVGLQTAGKAYAARASNIHHATGGRFQPGSSLNEEPEPLTEAPLGGPAPLWRLPPPRAVPTAVLITEDDCAIEQWAALDGPSRLVAVGTLSLTAHRSSRPVAPAVAAFDEAALADAARRVAAPSGLPVSAFPSAQRGAIEAWAREAGAEQLLLPHPCVGWTRDALGPLLDPDPDSAAALRAVSCLRRWDEELWPLATGGFFRFHKRAQRQLPDLLAEPSARPAVVGR